MARTCSLFWCVLLIPPCVSCGGGGSVPPPLITITVIPASATVSPSQTKQFFSTVSGTTNSAVNWSVVGGAANGTVSATGLYTAPATIPTPAVVAVRATSQADTTKSASASVTIAPQVAVTISPVSATVPVFMTQQFTATVNGVPSNAVTWQVNGTVGGSQVTGYISTSGLYFAPGGVPTKSDANGGSTATTVSVAAVSTDNPTSSASAIVILEPPNRNAEALPIVLGTSGSNAKDSQISANTITCCGGTLGSLLVRNGTQYILSNNHVLARSDQGVVTSGMTQGDAITQPGLIDNNCSPSTTVAHLSQFFNLETGNGAKVDAAIAEVVPGAVDTGGNILLLGAATDASNVPIPGAPAAGSGVAATIGRAVAKSGRTTGLTCSTVLATNVSVSVKYQKGCGTGTTFTVTYSNQVDIAGGGFSAGGDSGSLIVTQDTADPTALLYAGSDMDTVGNPISDVLKALKDSLGNVPSFAGAAAHAVIGCTLPVKPAAAAAGPVPTAAVAQETLQRAAAARDAHAPELLAHPEVQAVGIGASFDNPAEPAIVFFVTRGQPRTQLPVVVDGVRTRILKGDLFARRGALSAAETAALEQSVAPPPLAAPISDAETARARAVHAKHVDALMAQPGVQGVGISSSVDAPGEAALLIFLIRGEKHGEIPPVLEGLRTRVRESSPFRAGFDAATLRRGSSLRAAPRCSAAAARAAPPSR